MKAAARNATDTMRRVDPDARFQVRFRDGEEIAAGDSFARCRRRHWIVSSTSFEHGGNRLFQTVFSKGLNNDLPWTREHIYR